MRRVIAAVFGATAGTALLVALKAGPDTGRSPTPATVAATPPLNPSGPLSVAAPPAPTGRAGASSRPSSSRGPTATHGATPPPPPAAGPTATFTGPVAQTEYGPVQVRIVMSAGKLTDVSAVQLPSTEARSVQLSRRAAPILRQEALSAQSATINTVSGATYTSQGYRTSLQAALDAAKRG